ncbi:Trk system potassium transporter TrkA [Aminipila butyrica]|uniref:Trk system potassium uptake protein TrkA n=1 Tax=Aminipila butyrica TaxID=433296 RepID=A0A858C0Q9_9FIRM|nr:Trk system potassium transporter TrkA [Aminipila butyrica]QIB69976.1 Trk system potassium transporter TrkA [Aminipila butyrica]
MKIAIAGAGKLGLKIAESLLGGNHSITIIDKDEEVTNKLNSHMDILTVTANVKQISILQELNIHTYDYFLAATDRDEKNIVVASFAKKLGCPKVIARVRDPEHMNQLDFIKETMDIDYIVNPDLAITVEIYKYLVEKYTLGNGIFSSGKASLLEFPVKKMPQLIGATMAEMSEIFPGMLLVAVSRSGKVIIPHGKTSIEKGDGLYIIGERQPIQKLASKVHEKGKYTNLQKVMIIGGGKTGLYLAKKLSDFGISVKIIERNKARCHYLSTHLDDVMILHGDATDINLLEEENLDDMDAVVTATGFDEENLLLALMAKQHNIEDVIAKVSRESYVSLIEKMGIDMALNPLDITAASILRFIQGSKRVLSSQLIQGQAEVMEIIAVKPMPLVGVPLKNLKLPEGVIVAAIHRGIQVIIPDGETKIQEDDKVIILCLLSELTDLEKFLSNHKIGFLGRR